MRLLLVGLSQSVPQAFHADSNGFLGALLRMVNLHGGKQCAVVNP